MNSRSGCPRAAGILTVLLALPGISHAQVHAGVPMTGPEIQTQSQQQGTDKSQPKNLLTMAQINDLDAGFRKKMDAAQDAFEHEKFGDAEDGFSQLAEEIQGTIKRISTATLPKNTFVEIDGVKKPVTGHASFSLSGSLVGHASACGGLQPAW